MDFVTRDEACDVLAAHGINPNWVAVSGVTFDGYWTCDRTSDGHVKVRAGQLLQTWHKWPRSMRVHDLSKVVAYSKQVG